MVEKGLQYDHAPMGLVFSFSLCVMLCGHYKKGNVFVYER